MTSNQQLPTLPHLPNEIICKIVDHLIINNHHFFGPGGEYDWSRLLHHNRVTTANNFSALDPGWRDYVRLQLRLAHTLSLTLDLRGPVFQRQMPPAWIADALREVSLSVFPSTRHPIGAQNWEICATIVAIRNTCPALVSLSITYRVPGLPVGQTLSFPWNQLDITAAMHYSLTPIIGHQRVPNRHALRAIRYTQAESDEPDSWLETLLQRSDQLLVNGQQILVQMELLHCQDSMMIVPTQRYWQVGPQQWS